MQTINLKESPEIKRIALAAYPDYKKHHAFARKLNPSGGTMTRKTLDDCLLGSQVQLVAGKKTYLFNTFERRSRRAILVDKNGNESTVPLGTSVYVVKEGGTYRREWVQP